MTFQFDTSGVFHVMPGHPLHRFMAVNQITWADLSPFVQGYLEALFETTEHPKETYRGRGFRRPVLAGNGNAPDTGIIAWMPLGFSDLAPATLARIMEDCERILSHLPSQYATFWGMCPKPQNLIRNGSLFWKDRQSGLRKNFPPLTPYLGDDGLIYLREGA